MWCYRRLLKIPWADRVTNEEVLRRVGERPGLFVILKKRDEMASHLLKHLLNIYTTQFLLMIANHKDLHLNYNSHFDPQGLSLHLI